MIKCEYCAKIFNPKLEFTSTQTRSARTRVTIPVWEMQKQNFKEKTTLTIINKLAAVARDLTHNLIRSTKKRTTHANRLKMSELQRTHARYQYSVRVLSHRQNLHPQNLNHLWWKKHRLTPKRTKQSNCLTHLHHLNSRCFPAVLQQQY